MARFLRRPPCSRGRNTKVIDCVRPLAPRSAFGDIGDRVETKQPGAADDDDYNVLNSFDAAIFARPTLDADGEHTPMKIDACDPVMRKLTTMISNDDDEDSMLDDAFGRFGHGPPPDDMIRPSCPANDGPYTRNGCFFVHPKDSSSASLSMLAAAIDDRSPWTSFRATFDFASSTTSHANRAYLRCAALRNRSAQLDLGLFVLDADVRVDAVDGLLLRPKFGDRLVGMNGLNVTAVSNDQQIRWLEQAVERRHTIRLELARSPSEWRRAVKFHLMYVLL